MIIILNYYSRPKEEQKNPAKVLLQLFLYLFPLTGATIQKDIENVKIFTLISIRVAKTCDRATNSHVK